MSYSRTEAQISLAAIRQNIEAVKGSLRPGVQLMVVVKANAYGHGAVPVAKALMDLADSFAVASVEEGEELRSAGIALPILVLGYTSPEQYKDLLAADLTPTIYSVEQARLLSNEAMVKDKKVRVHVAVDTGMGRIGFAAGDDTAERIKEIAHLPGLVLEGLYSHFACADMTDRAYTEEQIRVFQDLIDRLKNLGIEIPLCHISNSAGVMEYPEAQLDLVRAGIVTYGIYPSEEVDKTKLALTPALSWRARVTHVKTVGPGKSISYGATYTTSAPNTKIATISIGYADGYPRALSGKGRVLIRGKAAPILGRVCMDQFMVDVSDILDVAVEDVVTLIGRDGDACIPVEEVADPAGRFNYEMLCDISARVPRVYVE